VHNASELGPGAELTGVRGNSAGITSEHECGGSNDGEEASRENHVGYR
jgi:hypothetical protein